MLNIGVEISCKCKNDKVINMKMLFKKMLRDFKDHKAQFLSIFLMALIGVFAFTGISGEAVGLVEVSSSYYEDTNLADGWIYSQYLNDLFLYQE